MKGEVKITYNLELNYDDLQDLLNILDELENAGEIYPEDVEFYEEFYNKINKAIDKVESAARGC